jgi:ribosomal protein L11 methyltransferase
VILANIQKNVILEILGTIRDLLSDNGVLFVSGILTNEDESMRRAFADHGFKLTEFKQEGEWVAYMLMSTEM